MRDIVERLNMRPFRYAAETELQARLILETAEVISTLRSGRGQ